MDYNDLWKVMIVPSITSQATFSNSTIVPSTRTLSTISERESKLDFCLSFDENENKKDTYRNAERSEITSSPLTCHDYSPRSFKSDKPISTLHGNKKESHDRTKDKVNKEDIHSQICNDTNNASVAPFIELGAIYKILDFITDSDSRVSLLTNNCCNEFLRALQCLLAQRHKKLEDLLSNDSSLHRCEHCGVISCILESHPTIKKLKRNRTKTRLNDEATAAERDCINNNQNNEKSEISISSPNLINNVQSRINDSKVNNQTEYTDKLSEIELLPTKEHSFVIKKCVERSNEANNISVTKASINPTIKNKFYPDNNAIKRLYITDLEIERKNKKRYKCNSAERNNPGKCESSNAIEAYASIDREEVVREILYEPKSQIDDSLARDRRSNIQGSQQPLDKRGDIYPVVDTVKYLARGQFTGLDEKENELLSKLQEKRCTRPDDARDGRSSVLYGSREDYSQRDAGFWLFDESGHLPRIALDDYRYLPMPRIDNSRENVSFPANVSRYSHAVEKTKTDNWSNHMEKDSLEDCALQEQRRESEATIFSSSSVENLMYGSLNRKYEINNIDDEDVPRGRQLVSSRPSLDIARHVRAQIAKDRHSGNAKESIGELYTHESNILVRLSPETRRKICHLIKTIVSDKNSTCFYKKYLINNMLNGKKLPHSKSADAAFAHSNRTDNEIRNICANDCVPTKLSDLSEGKDRSVKRQGNFVNLRNQNLNRSKNSVKIYHETTTSVSADNPRNKIIRQIIYKDALLKNIVGKNNEYTVAEMLSIYRKILENSRDMDWENFREFVEVLHPNEKELWRDVCRIISEEARRISGDTDDNTEICIEISPVNPEETPKTGEVMTSAREIVFELDMTLKNVENFSNKRFAEERLDTHKNAVDVTNWSNSGRWERISK
ncbi:uncharacterized protein LOC112467906 [Temnothorax curvispinosus]|uniref:Uncharacterized protein LOC112467906 n=1 Tax=Temnothorax curvispinosus TaxID=300111 RepID=A0A6J1RCS1_9HYME|nr:uncharacterized protein LOC112467906 [Temnothorax curvispinosus]